MESNILSADQETLVTETHHYDEETGTNYLEQVQDVTDIVEENKALYNLSDGVPRFGDGKRVASIPMVIYMELQRQGITKDPVAFKRWLNDPDNRCFRTLPGVV